MSIVVCESREGRFPQNCDLMRNPHSVTLRRLTPFSLFTPSSHTPKYFQPTRTRKGREAKESGSDDRYTASPTARSFVPYYAQRLSATCVLYGALAIQKALKRKTAARRSAAPVE